MTGEPNTRLSDLFGLAGWSKGELARMVNRQAAAMGHPQLATDTSRVRRWIDMGESPRDPVPEVLAALFTERLGRVVTIEDLGFGRRGRMGKRRDAGKEHDPDQLPWAPERTAAVLTEFTGMDLMLNRRGMVGAGAALAAGSTIAGPMYDWLRSSPASATDAPRANDPQHADPAAFDRYEAAPVGSEEIEALEHSVEVFRAWDASAAAASSARPSWASSTRWAACSPTATPTICSAACGASPPTSPYSRAGCPTTSASNPPPRSTSSSPPTRPGRAATGREPVRRSPAPPARWSTWAAPTTPST